MASVLRSGIEFVRGAYGAIILAAAAISDPLLWPKAFGLMSDTYTWPMEVWERQLLFAALAFLWLFVWYHIERSKFEDRQPPEPDMPLYQVCRWIARDSVWASEYRGDDSHWAMRVQAELFTKWQLGRFEMLGLDRMGNGGMNYLPPAMKGTARFETHKLVTAEPPHHIWSDDAKDSDGSPRCFYDVKLDRRDVTRVWPKRSLLSRLRGKSPVERIAGHDYGGMFTKQDEWYSSGPNTPEMPLTWVLGQ